VVERAVEPEHPVASRAFAVAGVILVTVALSTFASGGASRMFRTIPFDQTINMVAAQRLVDRDPLYDADASRAQAVERAGHSMDGTYTVPTNGFPGLPSTALVHVPFLLGSDEAGYTAFRWASLLSMFGAVVLVARTLPRGARLAGGLFGSGALLASNAVLETIGYGQGHGFVMFGFALAIWGIATDRWKAVGIGLGWAAALKLTPALIVVYLAVRGRKQVLGWAAGTVAALAAAAAVVGRPQDLWTWATEVAPSLSGGAYQILNQSVPAVVARVASTSADFDGAQGIGAWRHLAVAILAIGAVSLWRIRRHRPIDPLEVGVLLVLGLVAGPLTWDHYASWAALPLVLFADPRRWAGRSRVEAGVVGSALGIAVLLMTLVVAPPSVASVRADGLLRWTSSPIALALVLLLGASYRLVADPPHQTVGADTDADADAEALVTGSEAGAALVGG